MFEHKCDELEITQEQYGDLIEELQDEVEDWKQKYYELKEKHEKGGMQGSYAIVKGMSDQFAGYAQ